MTATVSLNQAAARGTLTLMDGATKIAEIPGFAGTASFPLPATLGAGLHTITAGFSSADAASHPSSTPQPSQLSVTASTTTVKLNLSKSVQRKGEAAAKVTKTATRVKSGSVYLYDGKNRLKYCPSVAARLLT